MASFCKAPPTAEQLKQQHLEDGQKFKQQVQKQRADKHERKSGGAVRRARNPAAGMGKMMMRA
jgi:hypothetical protein